MTVEQPTEDAWATEADDEEEEEEETTPDEFEEEQDSSRTDGGFLSTEVKTVNMAELKVMLDDATANLDQLSLPDFIQSLSSPADIYQQAVASASQIGKEFVERATDLAESMRLILTFDQLVLKKLNQSTAFDYGLKPKTEEDTKAIMINRANKILEVGQEQYETSHGISEVAKPIREIRLDACDDVNTVQAKINEMKEAEKIFRKKAEEAAAEEARLAAEEEARLAAEAEAAAAAAEDEGGVPPTETTNS